MLILIEVQKTRGSEFEVVGIVDAADTKVATEEADRQYAGSTYCRSARYLTDKVVAELAEKGFKVCAGGPDCQHGSDKPHLVR